MKVPNTFTLYFVILITLSLISCEGEQEQTVTEKEVPKAVLQTFNNVYPLATIKEYTKEKKDGQIFYEVSCEFKGR